MKPESNKVFLILKRHGIIRSVVDLGITIVRDSEAGEQCMCGCA